MYRVLNTLNLVCGLFMACERVIVDSDYTLMSPCSVQAAVIQKNHLKIHLFHLRKQYTGTSVFQPFATFKRVKNLTEEFQYFDCSTWENMTSVKHT